MANDFYTASGTPSTGSPGSSAPVRSEFVLIQAGFNKLAPLTASSIVAVNAGGTAQTNLTTTGTGDVVLATSPTLVSPALGTPTSGVLTNCTGLPIGSAVTGTLAVANGGTGAASAGVTALNNITGQTYSGFSGTGNLAGTTSPTFTSPVLGAATATSINKVSITAPASSATLVVADGKTFTASKTLTLTGTDGTVMTFPSTSATLARTDAANTFTGHQTIEGVTSTGATGTGKLVFDSSPVLASPHATSGVFFDGGQGDINYSGAAEGSVITTITGSHAGNNRHFFYDFAANSANNAATCYYLGQNSSTGRSINAGGTINASGADYAEYETKADGCGIIAKGQIVGFDADGKLTDKFAAAISFGIKSTNPSYVGGDVWGNEEALGIAKPQAPAGTASQIRNINSTGRSIEVAGTIYATAEDFAEAETQAVVVAYEEAKASFEAALEEARSKVDRIAYSGKVPVNIVGAAPGDYLLAEDAAGGIGGKIVSTPTFEQYRFAVGRVRNLLPDGRCIVAVIVH